MNLLDSKLQFPKRYNTLSRKRLCRLFRTKQPLKLITVIAGAGYGKTTLVMDALKRQGIDTLWYRLDSHDQDFQVFVSYLYHAVRRIFPSPHDSKEMDGVLKTNLQKQTDTLLDWLALLEKRVTRPIVLVLDDYHLVQKSAPINHAVAFILSRLADHIRLVIIGRKEVPIPLSTLRARQELIEISEGDLAFTVEEIRRLFVESQLPSGKRMEDIHFYTGGWVAALVLLRYAINRKTPERIADTLESFQENPRYIFSYLKENLFDPQPDAVKVFMMKAALLPEIDIRVCSEIFETGQTDAIVKTMLENHLMIFPMDESETVFYLHHLFKEFLLTQLEKRLSPSQIDQLHYQIAQKSEKRDLFLALEHYIEAHAFEEAIRLIETHEMKFLLAGTINCLDSFLKRIPEPIMERNPQLLLIQAKLFSHYGNPGQALQTLTRAHKLFQKQNSKENMIKCLAVLGTHYYTTGYIKEAKLLMEQVLDEVDDSSSTFITIISHLILLCSVLGEFHSAEQYYRAMEDRMAGFPDIKLRTIDVMINIPYSATLFFKGDLEQSKKINTKVLQSVVELRIDACLPIVYYQHSAMSAFFGAFDEGIIYAEKGVECCEKMELSDSQKGWLYFAWAENCLGLGNSDQAMEMIDRSIELFEGLGYRWGLANAWDCLHRIFLAQGKSAQAAHMLTRALEIIDGYGLRSTEGNLGNRLANLLMMKNDFSKALVCLDAAREKLSGMDFYLFNNHLLTSQSYYNSDRIDEAFNHLAQGLLLSIKWNYDRFIKNEAHWILPILETELPGKNALDEEVLAYLERLFNCRLATEGAELTITLLGRFKVLVGGKEIPTSHWKSSKALMILKYLAANRNRGFLQREELIEMLWPEEEIQKTAPRFNMAMSVLRKTLEPRLPPKKASAYIERKKDTYRLFRDRKIRIDTEQFSDLIRSAMALESAPHSALESYLAAESLYRGAFLEEDRYQEWCLEKRERFAADHLMILKAVASIYETVKEIDNEAIYIQKVLTADPFDENALKKLMSLHARSGKRSKIKQLYMNHKKMSAEMDCSVSPEISDLYQRLI